ncbi:MAG: neutral/alkaline non-lysosomal ceramidase N-terminal domain-containing protein, partial [Tannerellaceae bacterium]|nr:neutral/alkaline non-lysosomal ceramidase N-terminal domain-containing protein [Tannerellaceae bacterium]
MQCCLLWITPTLCCGSLPHQPVTPPDFFRQPQLTCNIGVADITPKDPVALAGFAARRGLSTDIHCPLKTHCLVFQNEKDIVCIITNDMMELPISYSDSLRTEISKRELIPYNRIFIHNTHTHSAPRVGGKPAEKGGPNHRFAHETFETIVSNAVHTIRDKKSFVPFSIEVGRGTCDINCNRREANGPCDHDIYAVRLLDKTGKTIAGLLNYSCHPVSLNYKNLLVSTDFPGIATEDLSAYWGTPVYYFSGAQGNTDPCGPLKNDTAYTRGRGHQLANAVKNIRFTRLKPENILRVSNKEVQLPFRKPEITEDIILAHVAELKKQTGVSTTWPDDVERWKEATLAKIANKEVKNY